MTPWKFQKEDGNMRQQGGGRGVAALSWRRRREGGRRKGKGTAEGSTATAGNERRSAGVVKGGQGGLKRKLYSGQCGLRARCAIQLFLLSPDDASGQPSPFPPPPRLPFSLVAVGVADASNFIIPSRRTVLPFSHPPRFTPAPSIPLMRASNR